MLRVTIAICSSGMHWTVEDFVFVALDLHALIES